MTRQHIKENKCPKCGGELKSCAGGKFYECKNCGKAWGYRDLLFAGQTTQSKLREAE